MPTQRKSVFGPLPGWELFRLARRGQASRSRLMVLYILFIAFVLAPVFWFTAIDPFQLFMGDPLIVSLRELAAFSNRFSFIMVAAILFAMIVMAPGYAAAAIAEEKESRTLPLLLTTELTDREIVLGKAAGRFLFLMAAAGGAIPVLAITTLFGGVSLSFLLSALALIASTAALTVAIGIYSACVKPDLRSALLNAYSITGLVFVASSFVPPCFFANPFVALYWFADGQGFIERGLLIAYSYALIQIGIAKSIVKHATRRLRDEEPLSRPQPLEKPVKSSGEPNPVQSPTSVLDELVKSKHQMIPIPAYPAVYEPEMEFRPPVDEDDPILWKERYIGRYLEPSPLLVVNRVLGSGAVLLASFGMLIRNESSAWLLLISSTAASWMFLSQLVVGLAAAIARERQRHTLDALRGIPIESTFLLSTKIIAVIERCWWWAIIAIVSGFVSLAYQNISLAIATSCFILAGFVLVLGIGAWLTVLSTTELKAFRHIMPIAVIVIGIPVYVANSIGPKDYVYYANQISIAAVATVISGAMAWRRGCRKLARME